MKATSEREAAEREVSFFRCSWRRKAFRAAAASFIWYLIGFLFYNSAWISLVPAMIGCAVSLRNNNAFLLARKRMLATQFEQALQSVSSSLHAGKSMENALKTAASDLAMMYSQHPPYLVEELERVNRMVEHGIALEQALDAMGRRLQIPDVMDWIDVFRTCKRTGGDLQAVMRHTSRTIGEKMDMEREFSVLISGKRFEADLLSVVPVILLGALRFGSPDYMAPLYAGIGRVIMTGALVFMSGSIYFTRRLMRFEW